MDTKTKTREDEKTPAGETQVRELGDVLASNKTESNSKSELLQELNKQYIKPEKLEALTQKDTLAQGRLIDVLGKCDYMELENKADVKIYVRTNQDRTIDVLAFENLEKPKPKNHTQGFTFTKVKDINALNKYVTELKEFDKLNKSDGARLASTIGLAFIGILGGAIYVATTLGSDASAGQVLSSVFLPAIPTGITGYFFGNKFDKKEYISKKEKQTKEIKKFQIDATYDIQALKSAMYE